MRAACCVAVAATTALLGGFCAAAGAAAEEALTLRYYKRARVQGGNVAAETERYVDGTLHGMLLLSDALQRDGQPVFCADAEEAGDGLDLGRLGAGFRGWLDDVPLSGSDEPAVQEAPVAMFALTYLGTALPCRDAAAGETSGGEDLGAVLRRALSE